MPNTRQESAKNGESPKNVKAHRSFWSRLKGFAKYTVLILVLLLISAFAAVAWITQTSSGQNWLVKTLNPILALKPGETGLGFRITSISGAIPQNFQLGIESRDQHGIWLTAPANNFIWDMSALPGTIHISQLSANEIDLQRFPDLPEKTAAPTPAKPVTVADIQNYIETAARFMNSKPWWLPNFLIDQISASIIFPPDLVPSAQSGQRIKADANLSASFMDGKLRLESEIDAANSIGQPVELPSIKFQGARAQMNLQVDSDPQGLVLASQIQADIQKPLLSVKQLPANFLGDNVSLTTDLKASSNTESKNIEIALDGPNLHAGQLKLNGSGGFKTGEQWKNQRIAGPLNYNLNMTLSPLAQNSDSPLGAIKAPVDLSLAVAGDFPKLNMAFQLGCDQIAESGHAIKNARIALNTDEIDIPIDTKALKALEDEKKVKASIMANIDGHDANIKTDIFLQNLPDTHEANPASIWRTGLRDLSIRSLGIAGTGQIAALFAPNQKPLIDGSLDFGIQNWKDLAIFLPGKKLSGTVNLKAGLQSELSAPFNNASKEIINQALPPSLAGDQLVAIDLKVSDFKMGDKTGPVMALGGMTGKFGLSHIYEDPEISAKIDVAKFSAANLRMDAGISANGRFSGPLVAEINSNGSVNSRISARWKPGEATINALEVLADITPFLKTGSRKKMYAGIKSAQPATIRYGDSGIQISRLDLAITPSGRLRANGGFAPDKLDLDLKLENLDFKPWQSLIPQIPSGTAHISANLSGSPKRPGGQFQVGLKNINFPKNPLPPINLGLTGSIAHGAKGGVLKTKLDLEPQTVKALGGNVASVSAALPLLFGTDGVPMPDMNGPIQAQVRWDGALGPIWNLLPIPDRRLNGRININLDAAGTLTKPRITGQASVNKARYEDVLLGILLTDINLDLKLSDNGVLARKPKGALDSLPGHMTLALNLSDGRGGSVKASGNGALDGTNLDIKATIDRLKPLRRRDIHIELSGQTQVTGSATSPKITGEIIINKGEVLLNNLDFLASVTTLPITEPGQTKKPEIPVSSSPAAPNPDGNLNVRIIMLPRFTVEGRGLASIWKANLLVSGALDNPQITGNIESVRGNFDFLGKIFALTKGIVFFGGGSISNPLVDIDLTHETPDLTAHILVTGPVSKIRLRLTSDPSIPRDEIISRVLFGRSVNDLSRMEALQLAAAVAQLAGFGGGSSLLGSAKKALGVDVLRIGTADSSSPNQTNEDTGGGTTIEMGKYINDYIYTGIQQGFQTDSTAFIIEIEISPRASFELRTEQSNTWGGFRWKYNY